MWVTMTDEGPQMGNIALKELFDRKGLDPSLFGAYDRNGINWVNQIATKTNVAVANGYSGWRSRIAAEPPRY
jgi:hypothetical protein